MKALLIALPLVWLSASGLAETRPGLQACLGLPDASERLACYDRQAGQEAMVGLPASPAAPTTAQTRESVDFMSRYWELSRDDKRGTFNYTSYRPNFFLPLRAMRSLNRQPHSPTRGTATGLPAYQRGETKLQISMRSKVMEDALLPGVDLWVAYTQQSMWQLWNSAESAPFRNTDFQPEVILVLPTPTPWQMVPMGWRWRMSQIAVVHQSNGQSGNLSRSWNRVYGSVGLERDEVAVSVRLERRLDSGSEQSNDNPDIVHYLGRAETQVTWSPGRSTAALLWRPSLSGRGSLQVDWTYPVYNDRPDGLRWYVQLFNGFGETLQDYNFHQTSMSLGLTLFKF